MVGTQRLGWHDDVINGNIFRVSGPLRGESTVFEADRGGQPHGFFGIGLLNVITHYVVTELH